MSRIGRQPIVIPETTEVTVVGGVVHVKGPLGELTRHIKSDIDVLVKGDRVIIKPVRNNRLAKALFGTYAAHINNMVHGVNEMYEKKLIVEGIGYRIEVSGKELTLNVGFSHPVKLTIPDDVEVKLEKNTITVKGIDKDSVGEFAAVVRATKKPEPYKGKGIRYEGEIVRRKQGKRSV